MDKIAIVVQRYGKEVNGGAELHARLLAERLKERYEVDVLTSCSLDYHKWDNHYPSGEEMINGVRVLRFINENEDRKKARRLSRYLRGNLLYYNTKYKLSNIFTLSFRRFRYRKRKNHEQIFDLWIEKHGPVSKKMMSYIAQEKHKYKAFIFFSYLFYPTFFGLQEAAEKSVLIPTAHDEPLFYFSGFGRMFSLPRFIMYNTESEKILLESTYPVTRKIRSDIAGVGFDHPILDKKKEPPISFPYFVYIGRIDVNKGCKELIDYFSRMNKPGVKLVMIGKNHLKTTVKNDNIIFTGFIDEEGKLSYLQHCQALIIPSRYESLSMVTLEAMSAGKPVLANGRCDVLKSHIDRSEAGFVYYNKEDFIVQINKILNLSDRDKQDIAQKGKSYVEKNFQWRNIMKKFDAAIDFVSAAE
ncbi:MAG: glycosyltransferase family 4 protein [Proteiniphilum sp.]|uniref:glycosyltransferase family 4 protein n=1 Tax=Proteiniphilum sp. TaxID=1926877 RepID=UPI002ABBFB4F|nr:glycosyltransferase family 4 protein [Proteiniphilum sp.]MDY9918406.1 glycosyltransferase family 4 protein [Proteiniphilum sp.]